MDRSDNVKPALFRAFTRYRPGARFLNRFVVATRLDATTPRRLTVTLTLLPPGRPLTFTTSVRPGTFLAGAMAPETAVADVAGAAISIAAARLRTVMWTPLLAMARSLDDALTASSRERSQRSEIRVG